jgi:hypothetical protein
MQNILRYGSLSHLVCNTGLGICHLAWIWDDGNSHRWHALRGGMLAFTGQVVGVWFLGFVSFGVHMYLFVWLDAAGQSVAWSYYGFPTVGEGECTLMCIKECVCAVLLAGFAVMLWWEDLFSLHVRVEIKFQDIYMNMLKKIKQWQATISPSSSIFFFPFWVRTINFVL